MLFLLSFWGAANVGFGMGGQNLRVFGMGLLTSLVTAIAAVLFFIDGHRGRKQ